MQGILNIKSRLEENKKQDFRIFSDKLKKEEDILNNLYLNKISIIDSLKNIYSFEKLNIEDLKYYNNYLTFIKNKIDDQKNIIKQLEEKLNIIRTELLEISKERKILEKFKEKQYNIYLSNERKTEQKIIDEIISYNYNL